MAICRRWLWSRSAACAVTAGLVATAPRSVDAREPVRSVVDATFTASALYANRENGIDLALRAYWKPAPTIVGIGVGLMGARSFLPFAEVTLYVPGGFWVEERRMWRAAPALHWDYYSSPWIRCWVAGEVGLSFVTLDGRINPPAGVVATPVPSTRTTSSPFVGLNAGVAVHPVRVLSVGVQAAAHRMFGQSANAVAGGYMFGVVAGVHFPVHTAPE